MRVRSTGIRFEMGETGEPLPDGHGGVWFGLGSIVGYLDSNGGVRYLPEITGSGGQGIARDSYWKLAESRDRKLTLYRASFLRGIYESHAVPNPIRDANGPGTGGLRLQADGTAWFHGDDDRTIVRLRGESESIIRIGPSGIEYVVPIGAMVVASVWRTGEVRRIPSGVRAAFVEPIVLGGATNIEPSCEGVWFEGLHSFGSWSRRNGVRTLWKDPAASTLALQAPKCGEPWFAYRKAGRIYLARMRGRTIQVAHLPDRFGDFDGMAVARSGVVYLAESYPWAIVTLSPMKRASRAMRS